MSKVSADEMEEIRQGFQKVGELTCECVCVGLGGLIRQTRFCYLYYIEVLSAHVFINDKLIQHFKSFVFLDSTTLCSSSLFLNCKLNIIYLL